MAKNDFSRFDMPSASADPLDLYLGTDPEIVKRAIRRRHLEDLPRDTKSKRDLSVKVPRQGEIKATKPTVADRGYDAVGDVWSGLTGSRYAGATARDNVRDIGEFVWGYGGAENGLRNITDGDGSPWDALALAGAVPLVGGGIRAVKRGSKAAEEALRVAPEAIEAAEKVATRRGAAGAPDLRVLSQGDAIKAARKEPHLVQSSEGQYAGAPRGVGSKRKVNKLRANFDKDVAAGAEGADWYVRARKANGEWAGRDPSRQRLLAREEALWSAQADPNTNLGFLLQGHNAYEMGSPMDKVRTGAQAEVYRAARDAGVDIPLGKKTGIYGQHLDPTSDFATTGTNDIWHARGLGFTGGDGSAFSRALTPQEHRYMDYETMLAVDRANKSALGGRTDWTAHEIQAAPWVAGKARSLAERYNIDYDEGFARAAKTYPDFADKYTAYGTSEVVPYAGARHTPGALADDASREAYSRDPRRAWTDADGRDVVIDALGGYQRPTLEATGSYTPPIEGALPENNLVFVNRPLVGLSEGRLDDASRGMMDVAQATKGYIDAQGSSAWHKLTPKAGGSLSVPQGSRVGADTLRKLQAIGERYGLPDVVDRGDGVTLTNFMGEPSTRDTGAALRAGLNDEVEGLLGASPRRHGVDSGYQSLFELDGAEPGSGVVTDELEKLLQQYPESVLDKLDASQALRERARSGMLADAEGTFGPAREDIQRARDIISKDGLRGLFAARKAGVALPSLMALMSLYGVEASPGSDPLDLEGY